MIFLSMWTAFASAKYFARKERQRLEQRLEQRRKRDHKRHVRLKLEEQTAQVEDDLGRMLLLAVALRKVLLDNKLVSQGDIAQQARALDLSDGTADGKLEPSTLRPQPKPPSSPEEFLGKLGEQD